ncbi:MAG: pilus assembly protein [Gemmatimonadota bacterium]|jgi:Flp pilus assembly protein TadG
MMAGKKVRRRRRSWHRDRSGQAMVEFALVTPLLLILILAVVDFSRAWYAHQVITNTAREALRAAVVDNPAYTQEAMKAQINDQLKVASLDPSRAGISFDGWRSGTGNPATIELTYRFDFDILGPLMEWAAGDRTVTLHSRFIMRNE